MKSVGPSSDFPPCFVAVHIRPDSIEIRVLSPERFDSRICCCLALVLGWIHLRRSCGGGWLADQDPSPAPRATGATATAASAGSVMRPATGALGASRPVGFSSGTSGPRAHVAAWAARITRVRPSDRRRRLGRWSCSVEGPGAAVTVRACCDCASPIGRKRTAPRLGNSNGTRVAFSRHHLSLMVN